MANQSKNQSKEFRRVFANAFVIGFGDNDTGITFGFHQPPEPAATMQEEVMVVMTPRTMKLLAANLGAMIKQWENIFGEIPVPTEKLQDFEKNLAKEIAAQIKT
jgi:hypothetical protein